MAPALKFTMTTAAWGTGVRRLPGGTMGPTSIPSVTALPRDVEGAIREWWQGTKAAPAWLTLAWYDTVLRYRKSLLGPLWITLSIGIMLMGMGPLYSLIFGVPLGGYFPYVTLGIVFWRFISSTITEGCTAVTGAGRYMKQAPFPLSLFTWRLVAKNVIHAAHDILVFVPVAIYFGIAPGWHALAFVPAFALVVLTLQAAATVIGIACARFSDFTQVVMSVMQMLMFLTPVFWVPEGDVSRSRIIAYNPLYYPLELLRRPFLGQEIPPEFWVRTGVLCAAACMAALLLTALKRRQLVYWI
ncbi:MAG: ABC transporter permease [Phycisphaerales bacterium]|nr:ABC transporter permease [Phycisphaerales bacterium]